MYTPAEGDNRPLSKSVVFDDLRVAITGSRREVFKRDTILKLTFIARDPANPEADFLMSEDDLSEVAELLIRSSRREDVRTDP